MNDIRQWLTGLRLERFGDAFEREELTPANLPELTDVELKDPLCIRLLRSIPTLIPIVMCAALSAQAAHLEIEVRGIKVRTGQVHAGLFASAEDFSIDLAFRAMIAREGEVRIGVFTGEGRMPRPPTEKASAPANARTLQLRMTNVAPGTYALALYHDVNDDGKVDTNFDGVPLEP